MTMGMHFTYTLENIGNIDKASISIKPLTIIAGENSSGKTFVTKTLYTILNSINKNTLLDYVLKKNFQITKLKQLIKHGEKNASLTIDKIGKVEIDVYDTINFSPHLMGVMETRHNIQEIIFFDSPVYTKIRKALEKKDKNPFLQKDEDKYLKGYPEYIEELYHFIDQEYIDTPDFDAISHEIQARIAGQLDVSPSGDIHYTDANNNTIPLSLTAMGISNVGLIDLLLRNNIINKGSFLIMDEPEVHLHPQWQVFLAQILYKIAKNGANIIIATHSLDFLKAFENILKDENENAQEIIAINKMPYDEVFSGLSELEKVGIILDDLSKPFYDLYMQDS